jgi:pimeloyl-ACP methyl ester carboxylesterase
VARACTAPPTASSATPWPTSPAATTSSRWSSSAATRIVKGWEFGGRISARTEDRDAATTLATRDAQFDAITTGGVPDASRLNRLAGIKQPVLVANGDNDRMVPTRSSHVLADRLPDARTKIFPDAGHGFLFQYPVEFAADVNAFLA